MLRQYLLLMLTCYALPSARAFAGNEIAASGQKVNANKSTASSLAAKFKKIKEGMTEQEVLGTMNAFMPWTTPNGSRLQAMTHRIWARLARREDSSGSPDTRPN